MDLIIVMKLNTSILRNPVRVRFIGIPVKLKATL